MTTQKYNKQQLIDEIEAKKVAAFKSHEEGAEREQAEFVTWKKAAVMAYAQLVEDTEYDNHGDGWEHVSGNNGYQRNDEHNIQLYPPNRKFVRFNPASYDRAIQRLKLVAGDEIALKDDELSGILNLL